jgi:hypothetical protein
MYLECDISFAILFRRQDYSEEILKFSYSQYGPAAYEKS